MHSFRQRRKVHGLVCLWIKDDLMSKRRKRELESVHIVVRDRQRTVESKTAHNVFDGLVFAHQSMRPFDADALD